MSKINGFSVGYTAVGAVILWSGISGATLSQTFQDLISGKAPTQDTEQIGTPQLNIEDSSSSGNSGGSPTTTDSNIANDALKYVGDKYVWGGTPGTTAGTDNGTDCSGFVNMVVGRDLGGAIPGYSAGKYNGGSHGPVTGQWLLWGGATTIPRGSVQAGDLACWLTHIGIFTDNGQHVVSSLDTQSGVVETTVAGATPTGEPLTCRRLNNVTQIGQGVPGAPGRYLT